HRSAECPFEKPPVAAGHDVRVFLIELHEPYPARVETRADADMPEAVPTRAEQGPGCKQGEESVARRSAVRDAREPARPAEIFGRQRRAEKVHGGVDDADDRDRDQARQPT